jgi:2-keto-4-pentenoate hydratase/2-oxohepta-3-ene-1,7-dioic acid hydratase in catechol pathway
MKICRYNRNRLGLVVGGRVLDVTGALDVLPEVRWPVPLGDLLIANLGAVRRRIVALAPGARSQPIAKVKLLSPVANPSKIIGAPVNYRKHVDESIKDKGISHGRDLKKMTIDRIGLFLKANSALVGASEGVALRFPKLRNDHEVELAVVIGKPGTNIKRGDALAHVAGYAIGLDMTVRGPATFSFRKSVDSYAVLGPWLVTADEIADPDALDLSLRVGRTLRQSANTRDMILGVERLIEFASAYYTLLPGDIIMTGTPQGVGPVRPGQVMHAEIEGIGRMDVAVRAHRTRPVGRKK